MTANNYFRYSYCNCTFSFKRDRPVFVWCIDIELDLHIRQIKCRISLLHLVRNVQWEYLHIYLYVDIHENIGQVTVTQTINLFYSLTHIYLHSNAREIINWNLHYTIELLSTILKMYFFVFYWFVQIYTECIYIAKSWYINAM